MGIVDTIKSISLSRFGSEYIQISSTTPVQIDLENLTGPYSDIQLNTIIKKNDDSYLILSTPSINIDPLDVKSIHLSIVSQDSLSNNWNYHLIIQDGKSGTDSNVPIDFKLTNPYPNPFNGQVVIPFKALNDRLNSIYIFNISGVQVYNNNLSQKEIESGQITWRPNSNMDQSLSSGVFIIKMTSGLDVQTSKIMFIK